MENYLVKDLVHYCNVNEDHSTQMNTCSVNYYDLTFVISGNMTYISNGKEYNLKSGDALLFKPNTKRSRIGLNTPIHFVSFNFSLYNNIDTDIFLPGVINSEIVSLVCAYPFTHLNDLYFSKQKCTNMLNYILFEIINQISAVSNNNHIVSLINYINANLGKPISLNSAAKHVNLSKEYTASLFKKETGQTFCEYLNNVRLESAKSLLVTSNLSLYEIALSTGFENYNYFSRLFKRKFGITAVKYKNSARKKLTE